MVGEASGVDWEKLPIIRLSKEWEDRFEKQVWDACVQDGRDCRRAGMSADHPLGRMRDPDMTASWIMGWHQQDAVERLREKLPRKRR